LGFRCIARLRANIVNLHVDGFSKRDTTVNKYRCFCKFSTKHSVSFQDPHALADVQLVFVGAQDYGFSTVAAGSWLRTALCSGNVMVIVFLSLLILGGSPRTR
jgi:hypothetical protein